MLATWSPEPRRLPIKRAADGAPALQCPDSDLIPRSPVVIGNPLSGARMAVRLPRRLLFPSATWEPDAFAMREPCNLRISVFFCRAGSLTRHGVDHRLTPRSQVVLGNALGGARTAVRLPRCLPFPSSTWERGAEMQIRIPKSESRMERMGSAT